jgi:hypothetical protein
MCPNLDAAYLYTVFFGLTTLAHIVQMFLHRKWFSWVIVASGVLQTGAYVLRTFSVRYVTNSNFYVSGHQVQWLNVRLLTFLQTDWFVLLMVAPVWTNAFAYQVMGRMVYNFTEKGSVFGVKSWHFGLIFVLLDVFAFIIQVGGAVIASSQTNDTKLPMIGIHVYMGGIGFQQLAIFCFLALAARLHLHLRRQPVTPQRRTAFTLLYVEYVVVLLITVRIIFRLVEYSNGIQSTIPAHEVYQYIFDSTLMFIASVLFNIFHPGRLMPGKESNMPKRKERKALRKAGEGPKGRAGEYLRLEDSLISGKESPEPPLDDTELGRVSEAGDLGERRYHGYEYERYGS